jgi:hypothetical protein
MKQINDHIRAQELFSAYIDNQTTDDEKNFVVRHLAVCDQDCRAQLAVTRSLVKATRSLPMVKAPRSFVLPRSMARRHASRRSILAWYPALRLATVAVTVAFVLVFAGDALSPRRAVFNTNIPSAANVPQLSAAAQPTAVALNAAPPEAPTAAPQVPAPQSLAGVLPTATTTASAGANLASVARSAVITPTREAITATTDQTAEVASAPIVQPTAAAAPKVVTSAAPTANQVGAVEQVPALTIDPLRLIEIVLGVLVIILGTATLIIRQRARSN